MLARLTYCGDHIASQTYCGDHIAVYTNTRSLRCAPEANMMLYVNYTLIKNLEC